LEACANVDQIATVAEVDIHYRGDPGLRRRHCYRKRLVGTAQFFLRVAKDGGTPTVGVFGIHETTAPTNDIVEMSGDTSRPYK